MLIHWIRARIAMIRSARFILKHSDIVTSITRDRSFEDTAGEAINKYVEETYLLLPRRYKNILRLLHEEELLSEAEYTEYQEACTGTILGSTMHELSIDTATGDATRRTIPVKAFPWKNNPSILEKSSERTVAKIRELETDIATSQRDHAGFISTLHILPMNNKTDTD